MTTKNIFNNEYFEEIIINIPGNLFWKKRNGEYLGCNLIVSRILKLKTPSDIIGKKNEELFSYDLAEKATQSDNEVYRTGKELVIEETGLDIDGKKAIYITKKMPLINSEGVIIGLIGTSIDITAKKELEKSIAIQEELKKKVHHTKMAAGSIAHDLRTPLTSIKMAMTGIEIFLPKLIEGYEKAQEAGIEVDKIRGSQLAALKRAPDSCISEIKFSNHYINLILGNLNSSKVEVDGYTVTPISDLVKEGVSSYPCPQEELKLIHTQLDDDFRFWGDGVYLKNIINNLLKNSLFYIASARKGEIYIETKKGGKGDKFNYLIFKDTAEGAPAEVVEQMFDGYYSKREGGTGLGLSFCKNIMMSFKGDIKATSTEGEHMEFTLKFPKVP